MPTDQSSAHDLANRRMVLGLLLSLLAHALILSIGFGLSGMRAGGAGPIAVSLAPLPSSSPAPEAPAPAAEVAPSPPPAALTERPPEPGFRLLDPIPMAPPPAPSQAPARPARRRREPRPAAPRREAAPTPVIVQQDNPDAAFKVPLADEQADPAPAMQVPEEPAPLVAEAAPDPEPDRRAADDAAERLRVERQREAEDEARRLAQAREAEQQRLADEQRAQAERLAQAEREQARLRDEAAARERQLAGEREAETRRVEEERQRQERLAQEAARARELAAERALAEEQARVAAEAAARRLTAERERERVARQLAEEAARQRAQQLARQQEDEERERRRHAEQAAAQEERARQQAVEAERARQVAQGPADAGLPGMSAGNGAGTGGGLPRATQDAVGLGSRARELLRGIELPGTPPAALRPAQQMAEGRRRVVDTLERDVPLRLYVDSFRQKIERNAAQIRMQVAGGPGRADPLVSVALRSDGSVDDVTIVRSSGRADLDEAVRRIVRLNARYAAFPPSVAARFDVIEIRRIWLFAETLKLLEEVR